MRRNYVTFYSPGTFFAERTTLAIDQWDPAVAVAMSNDVEERHGARPYAFQFSTYLEPAPVPDGEGGLAEVRPKQISLDEGLHYIGGRIDTYDDVRRREDPNDLALLRNMRNNGWWVVVVNTRTWSITRPFEREDSLVHPETGEVLESGGSERIRAYRLQMEERFIVDQCHSRVTF